MVSNEATASITRSTTAERTQEEKSLRTFINAKTTVAAKKYGLYGVKTEKPAHPNCSAFKMSWIQQQPDARVAEAKERKTLSFLF